MPDQTERRYQLAAAQGRKPDYLARAEIETMFSHGDAVM